MTAGLRKSMRVKNNLCYASDWDKYKFYRNKIISLTRLSNAKKKKKKKNLASEIPQTLNTFFDYLDPPLNRTFFFHPIIPEDINLEISIL